MITAALDDNSVTDPEKLNSALAGQLSGLGDTFVAAGQKYGVDPAFLAAVAMSETGNGTSNVLASKNNAAGIYDSKAGTSRTFDSVPESIDFAARNLAKNYIAQGLTTPEQIGSKYAPVGANNDPNATNNEWPGMVNQFYSKISGATPSAPAGPNLDQIPDVSLGGGPIAAAAAPGDSLQGIPELTAIGSGEAAIPSVTAPQGDYVPNQQILADANRHPMYQSVSANPTVVSHDDSSVTFNDGVTIYRDGTRQTTHAGHTFIQAPGQKTPVMLPNDPKEPKMRTGVQNLTDSATGQPYAALINMDTGDIVKKLDDPSTRANTQTELMRTRIINAAKTQPGVKDYVNLKNNFDSLSQNAAIPADQRTPTDDAAAMQAFASVEHPGIGATESDKKQAQDTVPWKSRIMLRFNNALHNKSNTLTADAVAQMRDTAKRSLDGRQATYSEQLAPLIKEAQRVGMQPEEVNGILGAHIATAPDPAAGQPSATPAPAAQVVAGVPMDQHQSTLSRAQAVLADPNASPENKAGAQQVIDAQKSLGLVP